MKDKLKNKFKKNRVDILGYSSFFGLLATIVYTGYGIFFAGWDLSFNAVIIMLTSVIVTLTGLALYLTRQYDLSRNEINEKIVKIKVFEAEIRDHANRIAMEQYEQRKLAQIFHNVYHEYRRIVHKMYFALECQNYTDFEGIKSSFKAFMIYVLANIKEVFDVMTGDECAVCIKFLNEKLVVKTFMRDSVSYRRRAIADRTLPEYQYHENTAFSQILDARSPVSHYLSNNLLKETTYVNINKSWQNYYNATVVVPVRLIVQKNPEKSNILGFICVDNFKGNFRGEAAVDILASFCDSFFHLLTLFYDLNEAVKESLNQKERGK